MVMNYALDESFKENPMFRISVFFTEDKERLISFLSEISSVPELYGIYTTDYIARFVSSLVATNMSPKVCKMEIYAGKESVIRDILINSGLKFTSKIFIEKIENTY